MGRIIALVLSSYLLSVPVLGLIVSGVAVMRAKKPRSAAVIVEALLAYYVLFTIGITYFCNFVMHVFFGALAARFIGWADSPFQAEVGYASLGFSVVGFLAFRGSFDLRLAAVIGPALFGLGAAIGHIQQIAATQDFAPGNGGFVLYLDFIVPIFGLVLLWLQHATGRPVRDIAAG
jgi:hypothetical protein